MSTAMFLAGERLTRGQIAEAPEAEKVENAISVVWKSLMVMMLGSQR